MAKSEWRLIDTGFLNASENMALDDVILEAVSLNKAPNTIRFLQFVKPCVLVGYHQDVDKEVRLDYCMKKNVEINRRLTGGGAIYFEPIHLGWEVIAKHRSPFPSNIEGLYRFISEAVVKVLRKLGLKARFRAKNDIEIEGRKVSGTGGTFRGDSFLFQGTLLTDLDLREMLRCLRIPIKKLKDKEVESLKDRVTSLKWELGYMPNLGVVKKLMVDEVVSHLSIDNIVKTGLNSFEKALFAGRLSYFASDEWINLVKVPLGGFFHSSLKTSGGLIKAAVSVSDNIIQATYITGDFFSHPQTLINEVEARLKHVPMDEDEVLSTIEASLKRGEILGISSRELAKVVLEAAGKVRFLSLGLIHHEADSLIEFLKPIEYVLANARYLLLPYCAKPLKCRLRWSPSCSLCGGCEFKKVYEVALSTGFKPITIINYEYLKETLESLKEMGEKAWVGSCCEAFYEKRYEDLVQIGLPGLIVTIEGITCYDLGLEKVAYEGKYEGESKLKADLLIKLLKLAHNHWKRSLSPNGLIKLSDLLPHVD